MLFSHNIGDFFKSYVDSASRKHHEHGRKVLERGVKALMLSVLTNREVAEMEATEFKISNSFGASTMVSDRMMTSKGQLVWTCPDDGLQRP